MMMNGRFDVKRSAAERDTSLSAMVRAYLEQLPSHETETERLKRQEREIRSRIAAFTASDRLSHEDLHKSPFG